MFLFPLFIFIFETIQINFRATLENKKFSILSNFNTIFLFLFSVSGAYYFHITGLVVFRYFAYILSICVGIWLLKEELKFFKNNTILNKSIKKEFMKFSLISSFSNGVSQLLYIVDIFLISLILVDETIIASYKTATLIPFALNFIPISIMTFIYPYFAKNGENYKWIKERYIQITKYLMLFNGIISLILIIFAPTIVKILFGDEYLDSVEPFRILAFGYFIAASFRIPIGNILAMMKKVKFGMYLAIFSGVLNIILDIILIYKFGAIGAAFATVSVFILTSILSFGYFIYLLNKKKVDVL